MVVSFHVARYKDGVLIVDRKQLALDYLKGAPRGGPSSARLLAKLLTQAGMHSLNSKRGGQRRPGEWGADGSEWVNGPSSPSPPPPPTPGYFFIDFLSVLPLDEIALAIAGLNGAAAQVEATACSCDGGGGTPTDCCALPRRPALYQQPDARLLPLAAAPGGTGAWMWQQRGGWRDGEPWRACSPAHLPPPAATAAAALLPHLLVLLLPHLLPGHAPAGGHAAAQHHGTRLA